MIRRISEKKVKQLAGQFRAVVILGPRQSGKTTLTRLVFPDKPYASLETPSVREFATSDPLGFLSQFPEGAVLDEIQRAPELLSYLQQNLDQDQRRGKFILTGSNNFLLLEKISQSLAGRAAYLDLLPFALDEIKTIPDADLDLNTLLFKGGYPPVQAEHIPPTDWFSAYVRTYVERDVRQIRNIENLLLFERFLSLCAGRAGQLINYSNFSVELGVDVKTVQAWLGILQASYIAYLLPPYFRNFNKRVLKTPKLYFYDTGLACHLLRITDPDQLTQHPYRGALFENFIINELLKNRYNQGRPNNLHFWRDRSGHEIDVVIDEGVNMTPVEIKSGQTVTASFFKGLQFWEKLTGQKGGLIFYAGDERQQRSSGMTVESWREVGGY